MIEVTNLYHLAKNSHPAGTKLYRAWYKNPILEGNINQILLLDWPGIISRGIDLVNAGCPKDEVLEAILEKYRLEFCPDKPTRLSSGFAFTNKVCAFYHMHRYRGGQPSRLYECKIEEETVFHCGDQSTYGSTNWGEQDLNKLTVILETNCQLYWEGASGKSPIWEVHSPSLLINRDITSPWLQLFDQYLEVDGNNLSKNKDEINLLVEHEWNIHLMQYKATHPLRLNDSCFMPVE